MQNRSHAALHSHPEHSLPTIHAILSVRWSLVNSAQSLLLLVCGFMQKQADMVALQGQGASPQLGMKCKGPTSSFLTRSSPCEEAQELEACSVSTLGELRDSG